LLEDKNIFSHDGSQHIYLSFKGDVFREEDVATDAIAAKVGAMDVSAKWSAAEFGANVIARSVDPCS
jgi:hypothetical protein